jgi:hypothetical protein
MKIKPNAVKKNLTSIICLRENHVKTARKVANTKAKPPMEGIYPLWIFLPPGASINFIFLRIKIKMGVKRNPIKKDVNTARKIFIKNNFNKDKE